ncbi:MAG: 30S ribosomal protein S16 [Gammaproteobacteria bacterium]
MVVIRLSRSGAKKRPFYHVVVKDKKARRDGAFIERLGFFNPIAAGADVRLKINLERINHWINNGAQPSERVASLVKEFQKFGERSGVEFNEARPKKLSKRAKANAAKAAEEAAAAAAAEAEKEAAASQEATEENNEANTAEQSDDNTASSE